MWYLIIQVQFAMIHRETAINHKLWGYNYTPFLDPHADLGTGTTSLATKETPARTNGWKNTQACGTKEEIVYKLLAEILPRLVC